MSRLSTSLLILALFGLSARLASCADDSLHGSLSMGGGYLDSPLGIGSDRDAAYASEGLLLYRPLTVETGIWKFSYQGNAYQFGNDVDIDFQRQALGVEWFQARREGAPASSPRLSAGLQYSRRFQTAALDFYDHGETLAYLAFKSYPRPDLMWRGYAGLRIRSYGELPEECFSEPHLQAELKHFSENRITLGLSLRLGAKAYTDPAARRIWGTPGTPSTSQLQVETSLARGLSDQAGLRFALQGRWSLADFPYRVQDDIHDSPLLDAYASAGSLAEGALKILAPGGVWWEAGLSHARNDYGAILFSVDGIGSNRDDRIRSAFLSVEKTFVSGGRGAVLRASASWIHQSSTIAYYDYSGPAIGTSLSWQW